MRPNIGKYFYLSRAGDAFFFRGYKKTEQHLLLCFKYLERVEKKDTTECCAFFIPCEAVGLGV